MTRSEPMHILQQGMTGVRGGVERFIMNLYRQIDRDLVQFDFLIPYDMPPMAYEEEVRDMGGRIFRSIYPFRRAPWRAETELRRLFADHPEIGGVHMNVCFPYVYPLTVAARSGVNLRILHSHEGDGFFENQHRGWRARLVERQVHRYPTRYFVCSDNAAYLFPNEPYTWVSNGIDTGLFRFDEMVRHMVRARLGIPDDAHVIGFCGHLNSRKNPLFALDVFAAYRRMEPGSVFVVIGLGELEEELRRRIVALGLTDSSVLMLGGGRSDMHELYQAMDGFVLPSTLEGLPFVLVEAQCAGLTCVASREAVTDQAAITDLLQYRSLSDDARVWARALREGVARRVDRASYASRVAAAGFDMRATAAMLQEIYLTEGGRS
ncbi:glycosyltransferase [Bifidobacterium scaligerum]|uniref:Glycosyltransferase family 1 protein n=1 Tax=Bifidobacterium scaligerum TaxID=2052656 RepID=A0A2M9HS91_9BIFI|nr:glycosyltransferase [Bifidobacterium scaligerum]PJM79670.1 glycosyltransferase family 1 protein [Bifidobacterium scaligerum]